MKLLLQKQIEPKIQDFKKDSSLEVKVFLIILFLSGRVWFWKGEKWSEIFPWILEYVIT